MDCSTATEVDDIGFDVIRVETIVKTLLCCSMT